MHSFANMYGAFDVVLYFAIIQLFWLLINLLLILVVIALSSLLTLTQCDINLSISLLFIYLFIISYLPRSTPSVRSTVLPGAL